MPEQNANSLTPAETERLACAAEECNEVAHMICKILRHGYDSGHPDYGKMNNRALLETEMGNLFAVIHHYMIPNKDVNLNNILKAMDNKLDTIKANLHHQGR